MVGQLIGPQGNLEMSVEIFSSMAMTLSTIISGIGLSPPPPSVGLENNKL